MKHSIITMACMKWTHSMYLRENDKAAYWQQNATASQGTALSADLSRKPTTVTNTIPIQPIILSHTSCSNIRIARGVGPGQHSYSEFNTHTHARTPHLPTGTLPWSDIEQLMHAKDSGSFGWLGKNKATRILQEPEDWYVCFTLT